MRVLDNVIYIEANSKNFNQNVRDYDDIKYIVIHYTGNINDTARNNALYFREAITQTSAHYFVSNTDIYQSVPLNHAAYAVGLGARKEPYFKYPTMWKKITNNNSISIEICGSKESREGTDETKHTAAKLTVALLDKFNLTPSCVYRHYDVTGKPCPAWAVEDSIKWLNYKLLVNNYFYNIGDDNMKDTPENYSVFKEFMNRYLTETAKEAPEWPEEAMLYCKEKGLINDGRPNSPVTRAELATVLMRLKL